MSRSSSSAVGGGGFSLDKRSDDALGRVYRERSAIGHALSGEFEMSPTHVCWVHRARACGGNGCYLLMATSRVRAGMISLRIGEEGPSVTEAALHSMRR